MSEKINFEQFLEEVDVDFQTFVQELHNYLLDNNCKIAIEENQDHPSNGWSALSL